MPTLAEIADELYGLLPAEFTAARNVWVRALKDETDTELADMPPELRWREWMLRVEAVISANAVASGTNFAQASASLVSDADAWGMYIDVTSIQGAIINAGRLEVDALVLSPAGLFLVEIKSRPGTVTGDTHTWTWLTDGRERSIDNPLLLTDRKSKRLASLLRRQR